jgi:hypothetical protein
MKYKTIVRISSKNRTAKIIPLQRERKKKYLCPTDGRLEQNHILCHGVRR